MKVNDFVNRLSGKAHTIGLALTLLTAALLYYYNSSPGVVGTFQDDGVYVVTAKALAEGQGYRLISMPQSLAQTKYPIFYPFLLSLIWKAFPTFPDNLLPMKLLSMSCALLFFTLTYFFLIKFNLASKPLALGVVAMSALNPYTICFSSMVMSEMPFALISILLLYSITAYEEKPRHVLLSGLAVSLLAGLAYLTRSIGISIVLSCFAYLVSKRQFKKAVLFSALSLLVIGPWLLWIQINSSAAQSKVQVHHTSYTKWFFDYTGSLDLTRVANVFVKNGIYSVGDIGMLTNPLAAYLPIARYMKIPAGWPTTLVFLFVLVFALALLAWLWRRGYCFTALDFYLLFYLSIVMVWPWPPWRFFVPILPFVLIYILRWCTKLFERLFCFLPGHRKDRFIRVVVAILVFTNVSLNLALDVVAVRETLRYGWLTTPYFSHPKYKWRDMENWFQLVRANTPPDAVIASIYDSMFYLYCDRKTISCYSFDPIEAFYKEKASPIYSTSVEEILTSLWRHHIDYLVFLSDSERLMIGRHLKALYAMYPGLLSLSYRSPDNQLLIFKVDPVKLRSTKVVYVR